MYVVNVYLQVTVAKLRKSGKQPSFVIKLRLIESFRVDKSRST
jgi:hypothetical protein